VAIGTRGLALAFEQPPEPAPGAPARALPQAGAEERSVTRPQVGAEEASVAPETAYRRDGGGVEGEGWSRGVEEGC
jgi:hypothetical protein